MRWLDVPEVRDGEPLGAGCGAAGGGRGPGHGLGPALGGGAFFLWGRGGAPLLRGRYGARGMDGATECPERRDVTKQQPKRK